MWTHALMDIGATLCRIRGPRSEACPMQPACAYAAGTRPAPAERHRATRNRAAPPLGFRATSRWLRGRILDRLRDVDDGSWLAFNDSIGEHGIDAVQAALGRLARYGLIEGR